MAEALYITFWSMLVRMLLKSWLHDSLTGLNWNSEICQINESFGFIANFEKKFDKSLR